MQTSNLKYFMPAVINGTVLYYIISTQANIAYSDNMYCLILLMSITYLVNRKS